MGVYALLSSSIILIFLREPQRGEKEDDLTDVLSKGKLHDDDDDV
jgi:hypothetical protein